jgi:hypothetical protein
MPEAPWEYYELVTTHICWILNKVKVKNGEFEFAIGSLASLRIMWSTSNLTSSMYYLLKCPSDAEQIRIHIHLRDSGTATGPSC